MAWKNFQNGYPLYASELNNYLMNQSVATFASSAERASVLTAPLEGQVTWLQDTNAFQVYNGSAWVDINDNTDAIQKSLLTTAGDLIVASGASTPARLGIGSNGQVLTSNGTTAAWGSATPITNQGDLIIGNSSGVAARLAIGTNNQILTSNGTTATWASPAASGGLTLLSTTTLSGANTTISGINQTYKALTVRVEGVTFSATNNYINISPRNASNAYISGSHVGFDGSSTTKTTPLAPSNMEYTFGRNSFVFTIQNYSATSNTQKPVQTYGLYQAQALGWNQYSMAGGFNDTTNTGGITGFVFYTNTGNFTAGTVYIYGVN